jgi:hypothetical protein
MKGRDHSEDIDVDGRIILECTLGKWGEMWIGFIWLKCGPVTGFCEHGNNTFGFHKRREIS